MSTRSPNPNFKILHYKLSLQGFGTKTDAAANLTDHKAFTVSVSAFINCHRISRAGLAPPVTLPSNVIHREANQPLCRVRRLRRTENDGRFRYREHQIGLQCFSHTVRRQAPYPTKRASPQRALCFDQRPTAGAPSRSPTNSLQGLL